VAGKALPAQQHREQRRPSTRRRIASPTYWKAAHLPAGCSPPPPAGQLGGGPARVRRQVSELLRQTQRRGRASPRLCGSLSSTALTCRSQGNAVWPALSHGCRRHLERGADAGRGARRDLPSSGRDEFRADLPSHQGHRRSSGPVKGAAQTAHTVVQERPRWPDRVGREGASAEDRHEAREEYG
jgi:hypothetical protein